MKKGKLKIILLILAMTLSIFASGLTVVVIDGNDSMTYKVDPPKSKIFYFNDLMEEVEGPTDYWINFVVDGDELSFTSQNLDIAAVSVKGGPNYNLYTDLDDSESGLTAPTNPKNNKPYGISHYSFDFSFTPPPPPESEITVTKTVINESEQEIDDETEFSFKLEMKTGPNEWTEVDNDSPFTLKGGESKTITGLLYGEYRITEESEVGYTVVGDQEQTVVLENEDGERVDFTNMLNEDDPPPQASEITISKVVVNENEIEIEDVSEFTFKLEIKVGENEWTEVEGKSPFTVKGGESKTISGLVFGEYRISEESKSGYTIVGSTTQILTLDSEDKEGESAIFTNMLDEDDPPPPPPPPPDDDDDEPRPRPRPEPEPEEEDEEVLEIAVIEEPVPEAPPVIEVVEEVIPLATLPKTGASDQLLLSGLGAVFIALGLINKKR